MTSPLSTFDFNANNIRVVTLDDEPWFVARDVCNVLGLSNLGMALANINQTDVCDFKIPGQRGRANKIISKPALYMLVMRSDKPEAIRFQEWIAQVVLPAIEKDGGYVLGEEKVASGEMYEDEFMARAVIMAQSKLDRLQRRNEVLEAENSGMREELGTHATE